MPDAGPPPAPPAPTPALLDALRAGGEALDRGARGPANELSMLRDAGWLRTPLPVSHGGRGWGTEPAGAEAITDALLALGGASLPIARLYEGHVNALRLVARFATSAQAARVAARVHGGALLGVWGADGPVPVTLAGTGSDATLQGGKTFASGLGDVALAVVTARADAGPCMVLVEATDPARARPEAWDVDAMVGTRSGTFDCHGLPAGPDARLGPPGALMVEPDFHGGLWRLAACYAGALDRLARLAAEMLATRPPPITPPMLARLGSMAIEAEGAEAWARRAGALVEAAPDEAADPAAARRAVRTALFAREAVEQAAQRLLATAERVAGTAMHRRGSELGRLARDLRFYLRQADLDGKLTMATHYWLAG